MVHKSIVKGNSKAMAEQQRDPVDSVQEVLSDLKARAKKAQEDNDAFLFGVLVELIKVASPIATRAYKRQMREQNAKINAAHAGLRSEAHKARVAEREERARNRPHLTRE